MTSQKQIKANRKNAKKAGVKTKQGKEIVKYNALKHGLLAKEAVITTGDGAEDPKEFEALLYGLIDHYQPIGSVEEILVETMAVSYWRLRRAKRYEVGLIREQLDTYKDRLIDQKKKELKYDPFGDHFALDDPEETKFLLEREPLVKGLLYEGQLNNLLRYESAIDRQFYKALSELERMQRMRVGEIVPPPINLDISSN